MARGVTIELVGLKELEKKLGKLPDTLIQETDAEIGQAANDFENRAQEAAPFDTSRMRNDIKAGRLSVLNWEVVSPVSYSAYVEFGTITRVQVPADLVAYAAQFKGRGLRKSGGMPARPFFFPQLPIAKAELNTNLKKMMERITK